MRPAYRRGGGGGGGGACGCMSEAAASVPPAPMHLRMATMARGPIWAAPRSACSTAAAAAAGRRCGRAARPELLRGGHGGAAAVSGSCGGAARSGGVSAAWGPPAAARSAGAALVSADRTSLRPPHATAGGRPVVGGAAHRRRQDAGGQPTVPPSCAAVSQHGDSGREQPPAAASTPTAASSPESTATSNGHSGDSGDAGGDAAAGNDDRLHDMQAGACMQQPDEVPLAAGARTHADWNSDLMQSGAGLPARVSAYKQVDMLPSETENVKMAATLSKIMTLAGPLMVQNVFAYLISVVSITAIGRIGAPELAAASLATSIYTVTGHSLVLGLSSAMETLCGQAYGAGDFKVLGEVLQRALAVCWTFCVPVALLWVNSTGLMIAVGQDPEISALAGRYLAMCIPCIFLDIATDCMKKYLQAQRIVAPAMWATTAATLLSPVLFYVAIGVLGLGLDGAAAALVLCHLTPLVGVLGFVLWHTRRAAGSDTATWGGVSISAATTRWDEYLTYGVPAMLMISLDWWVYELAVLMTGWLPNAQACLGVGGICVAISTWVYMVPCGMGSAVNTCVSNALGGGDGDGARRFALAGLACGFVIQAAVVSFVAAFGNAMLNAVTRDAAVLGMAQSALPVLCLLIFWDGLNVVMSGVLRGAGLQAVGAKVSAATLAVAVASCYTFGFLLPDSLVQAVPLLAEMEPVARVLLGVAVAVIVQTGALATYISRWDWDAHAARVLADMASDDEDEEEEAAGDRARRKSFDKLMTRLRRLRHWLPFRGGGGGGGGEPSGGGGAGGQRPAPA